jgi:hypothetical protein
VQDKGGRCRPSIQVGGGGHDTSEVTSPGSIDNVKWNKLTKYNRNKTESGTSEQTMDKQEMDVNDAAYEEEEVDVNVDMEGVQIKPGLRVEEDPNVAIQVPVFISCQNVVEGIAFYERVKEVCVSEEAVGAAINGESLEEMTMDDYVKLFIKQVWVVKDDDGGITHQNSKCVQYIDTTVNKYVGRKQRLEATKKKYIFPVNSTPYITRELDEKKRERNTTENQPNGGLNPDGNAREIGSSAQEEKHKPSSTLYTDSNTYIMVVKIHKATLNMNDRYRRTVKISVWVRSPLSACSQLREVKTKERCWNGIGNTKNLYATTAHDKNCKCNNDTDNPCTLYIGKCRFWTKELITLTITNQAKQTLFGNAGPTKMKEAGRVECSPLDGISEEAKAYLIDGLKVSEEEVEALDMETTIKYTIERRVENFKARVALQMSTTKWVERADLGQWLEDLAEAIANQADVQISEIFLKTKMQKKGMPLIEGWNGEAVTAWTEAGNPTVLTYAFIQVLVFAKTPEAEVKLGYLTGTQGQTVNQITLDNGSDLVKGASFVVAHNLNDLTMALYQRRTAEKLDTEDNFRRKVTMVMSAIGAMQFKNINWKSPTETNWENVIHSLEDTLKENILYVIDPNRKKMTITLNGDNPGRTMAMVSAEMLENGLFTTLAGLGVHATPANLPSMGACTDKQRAVYAELGYNPGIIGAGGQHKSTMESSGRQYAPKPMLAPVELPNMEEEDAKFETITSEVRRSKSKRQNKYNTYKLTDASTDIHTGDTQSPRSRARAKDRLPMPTTHGTACGRGRARCRAHQAWDMVKLIGITPKLGLRRRWAMLNKTVDTLAGTQTWTRRAPEHTAHGRTNTRCLHPRDPALGKVREQVDAVAEKGKEKEQAVNAVPTGAILTSGGRGGTDSDAAEDGEERVCSEMQKLELTLKRLDCPGRSECWKSVKGDEEPGKQTLHLTETWSRTSTMRIATVKPWHGMAINGKCAYQSMIAAIGNDSLAYKSHYKQLKRNTFIAPRRAPNLQRLPKLLAKFPVDMADKSAREKIQNDGQMLQNYEEQRDWVKWGLTHGDRAAIECKATYLHADIVERAAPTEHGDAGKENGRRVYDVR